MLFTTAVFSFCFLPIVLLGYYLAPKPGVAAGWLLFASLFFYAWWVPEFTLLLIASIVFNHVAGRRITRDAARGRGKRWLYVAVAVDLLVLAYFKYSNFFVANVKAVSGLAVEWPHVVLPIGISFFTFTQIAYLIDASQGRAAETKWTHYGLFVTYFPHLIAGPILHHGQMVPQFAEPKTYRFDAASFATGGAIFALGLIKKIVCADGVSPYADAVFKPVDAGFVPSVGEAWVGAVAYTLQIYFDFSGYSDMAIGLSLLFNIRLPFNFDSPYRATSISDFWRRWHMSLSAFLRDYLYFALGGNRRGPFRRYANLLTTMLLGGLWHGANWTFVVWGALHGMFLCVNHAFRAACGPTLGARLAAHRSFVVFSWFLTMGSVVVAWLFFRAETLDGALRLLRSMAGASTAAPALLFDAGLRAEAAVMWCAALAVVALLPVNSNRIGVSLLATCRTTCAATAFVGGAALAAVLLMVLLNTARDATSAFIYFNF